MIRVEIKDIVVEMLMEAENIKFDRELITKAVENALVQYIAEVLDYPADEDKDTTKLEKLMKEYWEET